MSLDAILSLLAKRRRRHIMYRLREERVVTRDDVAAEIAAVETDASIEDVTTEAVERVHADLHHTHLPKLEGVIEYDERSGTIRLTDAGEDFMPLVEFLSKMEDSPSKRLEKN